jgi:predicted XRE-type DNA-binding protein
MKNWPEQKEIERVNKKLSKVTPSKVFDELEDPVDQAKYKICEQFVIYMNNNNLTQNDLALKTEIDKALINKIVHYHFERFTLDKLLTYLNRLYPKAGLKLEVA